MSEPEGTVTPAAAPAASAGDAITQAPGPAVPAPAPGPTVPTTGHNRSDDPFQKDNTSEKETLPRNPAQWNRRAMSEKVGRFLFDFDEFQSGSNVTYNQFLHLRAIWIERKADILAEDTTRRIWLRDEYYTRARQLLASWMDWRVYLNSFQVPENNLHTLFAANGAFWLVRNYQLKADKGPENSGMTPKVWMRSPIRTRGFLNRVRELNSTPSGRPRSQTNERDSHKTPLAQLKSLFFFDDGSPFGTTRTDIPESVSPITKDRRGEYPPTKDEQIVNRALVYFLEAVTMRHVENADWDIERMAFKLADKKDKGYEARVDGLLRRPSDGRVLAILEVKPCVRLHRKVDIRMQESAQMAAWISSDPDNSSTQTSANFTLVPIFHSKTLRC